ncbi:MAG: LysR substrate-binding domain-containing protein [Phenylobacterium sp.]
MADVLAAIPLSAIRVFEAAARLGSFTRAAEELGMTQAAVSWQVKALERRLDQNLFERRARDVALTAAGERLARGAGEAMASLRSAVSDLTDTGEGVLAITTLQTFASHWLAPRLGSFQLAHPKIAVRVESAAQVLDLTRSAFDVALRSGRGEWAGIEAVRLFPSLMTVLGTPKVLERIGARTPADLVDAPRIGIDEEWAAWFARAGVAAPQGSATGQLRLAGDAQSLEVAAALADQGLVLASPIMFSSEIAAGRLVQPFDVVMGLDGQAVWLAYPKDRRRARKIAAFRDWILAAVAEDPAVARYG